MNASIIAAQAPIGHSNGFTVIAGSIRGLATRTNELSGEAKLVLKELQDGAEKTVSSVHTSRNTVGQAATNVDHVDRLLEGIGNSARECLDHMREVGAATSDQSQRLDQTRSAAQQVREIAKQLHDAAYAQSAACAQLQGAIMETRAFAETVRTAADEQTVDSREINGGAVRLLSQIEEISTAVNLQRDSRDQIATALRVFRSVSGRSDDISEDIDEYVVRLTQRTTELSDAITPFRS